MFRFLFSILLLLGMVMSTANAINITSKVVTIQGEEIRYIKLDGIIKPGDTKKFNRVIKKWDDTDNPVVAVFLNSNGGDVDESYGLSASIIKNELLTAVMPKNKCLSACVAVFASGYDRILYPKSIVGVHRVRTRKGDNTIAKAASVEMMEIYEELDIPRSIRLKMIETPPDEMYFLTVEEMYEFSTEHSQFKTAIPKATGDLDKWLHENSNKPITAVGNYQ